MGGLWFHGRAGEIEHLVEAASFRRESIQHPDLGKQNGTAQHEHRPALEVVEEWTLLTKVETSCDRILIAGGANVEAEWEQGPAV